MNAPKRARISEPLEQLLVVLAAVVLFQWNLGVALAAVAALAVLWPPRVPWRPLAAASVVRLYPAFAVAWTAFAFGYLRLLAAVGAPVAPQPLLEQLARDGWAAEGLWLHSLGIVVVAPVVEELLFRGYLFTGLAVLLPRWATHLVTAVVFGLAHGPGHAVPIGVLSLLFGYLRERHGSLAPAVLAHALHNALMLVLVLIWPGLLDLFYGLHDLPDVR